MPDSVLEVCCRHVVTVGETTFMELVMFQTCSPVIVPYACDRAVAGEYEGPESTVPSSTIFGGSVAANSRTVLRGLSHLCSRFWARLALGPYACSISFLFIIVPIPSLACPLYRPKFHLSFPKRRSQQGVVVSRAQAILALLPKTWPFIGLTRLEQTFHWLISISHDFRSPKASFPIHLLLSLLFKHLDKGSLVPPMCTHGGSSFPRIITLFTQGRRVFRSPFQILVPRSGSSFLIPDPRSSFRM